MEHSFLYHGFGVDRSFQYHATEYKNSLGMQRVHPFCCKGTTNL